jgi:hypothetical protein
MRTTGLRWFGRPLVVSLFNTAVGRRFRSNSRGGGLRVRLLGELLKQLQNAAWDVTRHAGKANHRAWYHEIWALESRRSPRGFTLFLTFLTDPQPGNPNPFYFIGTSGRFPESAADASGQPTLAMTPCWEQELPRFVAALDAFRGDQADSHTE